MAQLANKIFTNTLWQVVLRGATVVIGILNLALIARLLGQAGFGYYTTVFAFVQMFMILADLGLYLALLREISVVSEQKQEEKIVNNIFTIRVLSSLIILILVPVVVQFFPYSIEVKQGVFYFSIAFFFQSLISTLSAVFAKKLAMPKVGLVDLLNKFIYLAFLAWLLVKGTNLNQILLTASFANAISFFIFYLFLKKYISLKLAFDFYYWKKVFYTSWPLAVTVILNLMYFKADTLVLSAYQSPEAVGLYGAPYRVLEVLSTFPHMFMSLILPLFTAYWLKQQKDKLKEVLQNSFDFFVVISFFIIPLTWLISRQVMIILAGKEFADSGPILNLLIVATVIIFFGTLFTYLVVALEKQREMIKYFLMAAVVGLVGYFIFIPRYSYWGAASMTLLVETLIVYLAYRLIKKYFVFKFDFSIFKKSFLAGALTLFLIWPIKDFNLFLTMALSFMVYSGFLFISKALDKQKIKQLFKKEL